MKTMEHFRTLNEGDGASSKYLAFSPSGLLAAQSREVEIWDLALGRGTPAELIEEPMAIFPGGYIRPRAMTWSPDGKLLATGCESHVEIWDLESREQVGAHQHDGPIEALAWSPDGRFIASCSEYGQMHLWRPGSGETVRDGRVKLPPAFVLWSPDGKLLATNPFTGEVSQWQVQIWDVETWSVRHVLDDGERRCDEFTCGAFSPSGHVLALGTEQGYVQIWSVLEGRTPSRERVCSFHQDAVSGLAWSPDGFLLLSGGRDQHVALWDAATGNILYHAGCRGEDNWVEDVAWWCDLIAVCDARGHIALYQAPAGQA